MASHLKIFAVALFLFVWAMPARAVDQSLKGKTPPSQVLEDFTNRLELIPGMSITFPIFKGVDTRGKNIGDYEFTAAIQDAGQEGFSYKWIMSKPADANGLRAVSLEDQKQASQVSLFYSKGQSCTMDGYTNAVRVSDAVYRGLKAGKTIPFQIDLEEAKDVPAKLHAVGEEYVNIFVDGKKAHVRAIKAETNNGWDYWIMDNARFPVMIQGNGPFRWQEPRFNVAEAEAARVIKDLEKNGVATTYAILFAFNSAKLENSSKLMLDGIFAYLKKNTDVNLAVEGHCDIVGSMNYNLTLSQNRADAVKNYLVAKGIESTRLDPKGYGYSKPIADNMTEAGRAMNRRVVFRKLP
jgi:outer membrane protein OmpA-like peptidoglycan-associated protein